MTEDKEKLALAETKRLQRELDITNADHIALWLEANTIPDEPMSQCVSWLACRIVEAHEAALEAIATPEPVAPVSDMVERLETAIAERLEMTNGDAGLVGVRIDDLQAVLASIRTPEAAQVEMLVEALKGAEAAIQAAYGQAEAEYQGHDTRAAKYDAIIRSWREKRAAALAQFRASEHSGGGE